MQLLIAVRQAVGIARIIQDYQFLAVGGALTQDDALKVFRIYAPAPLECCRNADDFVTGEASLGAYDTQDGPGM